MVDCISLCNELKRRKIHNYFLRSIFETLFSERRRNVEESQDEERVLNRVIEKMGECDIEDEDNLVELIEIAEEPPRKKQKQAKMTSFFVKKN